MTESELDRITKRWAEGYPPGFAECLDIATALRDTWAENKRITRIAHAGGVIVIETTHGSSTAPTVVDVDPADD